MPIPFSPNPSFLLQTLPELPNSKKLSASKFESSFSEVRISGFNNISSSFNNCSPSESIIIFYPFQLKFPASKISPRSRKAVTHGNLSQLNSSLELLSKELPYCYLLQSISYYGFLDIQISSSCSQNRIFDSISAFLLSLLKFVYNLLSRFLFSV